MKSTDPSFDTVRTYCTEDTPAALSHAGSQSDLSALSVTSSKPTADDKPEFSDDSSNLSGDNDNILAECIQSGMPKARKQIMPPKIKPKGRDLPQRLLKNISYVEAKDEMESYAVEDSPCHFSLRSSLSDLTVDGNVAGLTRKDSAYSQNYQKLGSTSRQNTENRESNLQKADSLSSLSVDSFGSTENAEQALLEQCISSGMPKSNRMSRNLVDSPPKLPEKKPGSKNAFATSVVMNTEQRTKATDVEKADTSKETLIEKIDTKNVKNGFDITNNMSGYKDGINIQQNSLEENMYSDNKNEYDIINKCSDVLTDCSIEDNVSPESSDSENKTRKIKNRMLDPDAMIESLDRFTAELVSHSSHLNSHECKLPMNQSVNEGNNTWDEDTSPNDVSFPSISISAPLVASFKSDTDSKISRDTTDGHKDLENKEPEESNQFSSMNTMSESTIIAMEATKVYNVVQSEANMIRSITSINSLDLENINPPSMMESIISLTSSASGIGELHKNSPKNSPLLCRKKSIPVMVRRALGNTNGKSMENLDSISSCNLEHVKPPSVMGDYLDMVDMESSMISVASITSEIADHKLEFLPNGLVTTELNSTKWYFDSQLPVFPHSSSDIENINPPSLLNEVTDLCNSTADVITENIYSETEVFEDCFTHTMDQTLQPGDTMTADEITEYSDAYSVTPVQSDFGASSAESTPKKIKNVNKRLTPKQKRQLAKERYKTYTVAAEMVIKEEIKKSEPITECPDSSNASLETSVLSSASSSGSPKLTPKERRQLDRERFQTRVLEKSPEITSNEHCKFATFSKKSSKMFTEETSIPSVNSQDKYATFSRKSLPESPELEVTTRQPSSSLQMNLSKLDIQKASEYAQEVQKSLLQSPKTPPMSPKKNKTDIRKAMQQKRLENKDRFRTRTISSDSPSPEVSPAPERRVMTAEELHTMLEHETNIILNTLEHTSGVDDYLECETLSLVSNDDDSEHNSMSSVNYRTYHKSWGFSKNLPVIQSQAQSSTTENAQANSPIIETVPSNVPYDEEEECETGQLSPKVGKPKITKPGEKSRSETPEESDEQVKAIRGKKKAYVSPYRSPNLNRSKPVKTVNSNLVKNVTSSLTSKSSGINRSKITPPATKVTQKSLKPPSGFNSRSTANRTSLPSGSTQKQPQKRQSLPLPVAKIERQGTFVKEDKTDTETASTHSESSEKPKQTTTSKIARAIGACKSKSATYLKTPALQSKTVSSTTKTGLKTEVGRSTFYSRSPSADRDSVSKVRRFGIHGSSSSQSLQSQESSKGKKSNIPSMTPRSNSNVSIASNESGKKKQVTSKIASLWKRVEESKKKQPEKKDNKVWIKPNRNSDTTNCDSTIVTF